MVEDVHRQAREAGTVYSITYHFPKEDLEHHGKSILAFSIGYWTFDFLEYILFHVAYALANVMLF